MQVNRRAALAVAAFLVAAWLLGLDDVLPVVQPLVPRPARPGARLPARRRLRAAGSRRSRSPCSPTSGRGRLAHRINPDPFYQPQIDVDKVIGLGRVPSVRLQGWLYDGTPGAFEHALDHVHEWHVAALLGALFLLWLDSPPGVPARRRGRARLRLRGGDRVPRLPRRAALAGRLPRADRTARAHSRARQPVPAPRVKDPVAPDAPLRRQPGGRGAVAARRLVDARRADHLALAAAAVADRRGLRARAAVRGRLPRRALRGRPDRRRPARARHVVAVGRGSALGRRCVRLRRARAATSESIS